MRDSFLPYFKPQFEAEEVLAVTEALQNGWLTTGPKVRAFEESFAARCGSKFAIALSSCTAALHVGLIALGVRPGDEVVMPSLTFVAGAESALEIGAAPVFCDVDPLTLSVTIDTIDRVVTPKTRAIITMPFAGRPIGIEQIVEYARKRTIPVLEDAAHGVGMLDRGHWAGRHSAAAAYSFYATKNLTTAEGGMLVTNDEQVMELVRRISLHGMNKDAWKRYLQGGSWRYDVTDPGFKHNLPDLLAALGLAQLERLDSMQSKRDSLADRYFAGLATIPGISTPTLSSNPKDRHSWCMFPIFVDEGSSGIGRDDLIEALKAAQIGTSVHYIPTHLFSAYKRFVSKRLPETEQVWQTLISLPLYPAMSLEDVDSVVEAMRSIVCEAREARGAVLAS